MSKAAKQTHDLKIILHEVQRIKRNLSNLEDLIYSRLKPVDDEPRTPGLVDPRDGKVYPIKDK